MEHYDSNCYDLKKLDEINALERMGIHVEYSEADIIDWKKIEKEIALERILGKRKPNP